MRPWTAELRLARSAQLLLDCIRLVQRYAVATFISLTITIVWTNLRNRLFGDLQLSTEESVLGDQATILAISLGALVLAALLAAEVSRKAPLKREARLQAELRAGSVITFDGNCLPTKYVVSTNATEILGLNAQTGSRRDEWP